MICMHALVHVPEHCLAMPKAGLNMLGRLAQSSNDLQEVHSRQQVLKGRLQHSQALG